jgi:hypothetical protein
MKNRICILLSVITFLFLSCGCGGDSNGKQKSDNPSTPDNPTSPTQETMSDFPNPEIDNNPIVDYTKWAIKDGKFYLDGKHVFLKIAKPLRTYQMEDQCKAEIAQIQKLREKYYNCMEIGLDWSWFDLTGDGEVNVSLKPLKELIEAVYNAGMYPSLGITTYSVGGGSAPKGFFDLYPDAIAVGEDGKKVKDDEYGFGTIVVDIFNPDYRRVTQNYIRNILTGLQKEGLDLRKILFYETTVEPQYMGSRSLSYTKASLAEYNAWRKANGITDKESEMPLDANGNIVFPVPSTFVNNPTWNRFRAWFLAKWINDDIAVYRSVAGQDAKIAVDYLDAVESSMQNRDGNPEEFLKDLSGADIIQINWTWYFPENKVNQKAYDRVHDANTKYNRNWAISEHMTFNGSDWDNLTIRQLDEVLENTLKQGTRFGWEFTNTLPNSADNFCVYDTDWTPRRHMKYVDEHWGWWLHRAEVYESGGN